MSDEQDPAGASQADPGSDASSPAEASTAHAATACPAHAGSDADETSSGALDDDAPTAASSPKVEAAACPKSPDEAPASASSTLPAAVAAPLDTTEAGLRDVVVSIAPASPAGLLAQGEAALSPGVAAIPHVDNDSGVTNPHPPVTGQPAVVDVPTATAGTVGVPAGGYPQPSPVSGASNWSNRSTGSRDSAASRRRRQAPTIAGALAGARFIALGEVDTFECPLCLCNEALENAWAVDPCGHELCRQCFAEFLVVEISEAQVLEIVCPASMPDGSRCRSHIAAEAVKELVPEDVHTKYERFVKTQTDSTYRECPTSDCQHLTKGNPQSPAMQCESCGRAFCYWHSAAHVGSTCAEYVQSRTSLNRAYIKEHTVICPKPVCGLPVEKHTGCNHMTCSRCRTDFCYLCGSVVDTPGTHYHKFNILGCRSQQFTPGGPNSRRKPVLWRACGLPLLLVLAILVASPFVLGLGAVWLCGVIVLAVCWVPYLVRLRRRFHGHIPDAVCLKICWFPCCFTCVSTAACEPMRAAKLEVARCCCRVLCCFTSGGGKADDAAQAGV